jgi:hypothetical protein
MKIRPLAVVIDPPGLTEPHAATSGCPAGQGITPGGTFQAICPVTVSTAVRAPQDSALQGRSFGFSRTHERQDTLLPMDIRSKVLQK